MVALEQQASGPESAASHLFPSTLSPTSLLAEWDPITIMSHCVQEGVIHQ